MLVKFFGVFFLGTSLNPFLVLFIASLLCVLIVFLSFFLFLFRLVFLPIFFCVGVEDLFATSSTTNPTSSNLFVFFCLCSLDSFFFILKILSFFSLFFPSVGEGRRKRKQFLASLFGKVSFHFILFYFKKNCCAIFSLYLFFHIFIFNYIISNY